MHYKCKCKPSSLSQLSRVPQICTSLKAGSRLHWIKCLQ